MSNGEHICLRDQLSFEEKHIILPECSKCVNDNPGTKRGFCEDCIGGDDIFRNNYFKQIKE